MLYENMRFITLNMRSKKNIDKRKENIFYAVTKFATNEKIKLYVFYIFFHETSHTP